MKPTRIWIGLVFLALGALGILHVAGILNASQTIDQWWPVGIIGYGVAAMLAARRFSFDATIVAAIGLAFLADEQEWAVRGLVWSGLFLFIGAAILLSRQRHQVRGEQPDGSMARSVPEGSRIGRST